MDESNWFPFVLAEKMDPSSPANIGKQVLDSPAGKHGFLTVKDGHFYFEDGTKARFWGTNLTFNACFPTKKQAEEMAERIAFFGFNAVRLHHMDRFEPRGIFKDITPAYKNKQLKETGHLSEKQLDKLDYLIYQLKKRGIYVNVNLLVSRHFTDADGVIESAKLRTAAIPVSMFDPRLIELQKKYAKDLLTHYNPYTKLHYNEDPTIALIEIANENSMFHSKNTDFPTYYQKQLNQRWLNWTENKSNIFIKTKKNFYIDIEKKYFTEMINFLKKDCMIRVPITGIGGYRVKEDVEAQEICDFIDFHKYWDHPKFSNKKWNRNDFRIHNKSMLLDKNLGIIGKILERTPNPKTKPFTISEWNHCFPNRYAYETPPLIASFSVKNDWDGLFQFNYSNGWKQNPIFNDIQHYFSLIANPQQLILCSIGSLIFHKTDRMEAHVDNSIFYFKSSQIEGVLGFIQGMPFDLGNITLTPDENGSVFLYSNDNKSINESNSLTLVLISEIKNTGSSWDNKGIFNWGKSPVLLRKLNADVLIKRNNKLIIYELNNKGARNKELTVTSLENQSSFSTKEAPSLWFEIISE